MGVIKDTDPEDLATALKNGWAPYDTGLEQDVLDIKIGVIK
eukprot:CAMPEP_0116947950 /NCGR_PEP_ID=MMETSP0467-20121206/37996_1 /TAXON_ID=283647 /ORGANISM="Mesodinium pulex, Strain SPMC105" /LENGTH=40 /DNA_ID= /DNA_START= /DNA_END= /DNA_ORIENTATION=